MARNPQPSADPVLLDISSDSDSPPPPQIITRRQARDAPTVQFFALAETSSPISVPQRSPDLSREVSTHIRQLTPELNEDNKDSDGDYVMSDEESSDSTDESSTEVANSTKLPQSPVETVAQFMGLDLHPPRAPTNQSDSSEASFWQKMRDNLLAEAAELRKQGDELYDRADKLRDMAKECEGEESEYPAESW